MSASTASPPSPTASPGWSAGRWAAVAVGFVALALGLVWPAIDGDFLSDDLMYIVHNPYVHGLSFENLRALLDPYGAPTVYTLNYAPVHLILHAIQWELVEDSTRLYNVTNAVAHGLTCLLLIPFFVRAGIPALAAGVGALWFLVHPANVETVAWIFQLKTIVAVALSLGALLLHERRPALAAALFALALLTKVTALGILPVVALQSWIRSRGEHPVPPRWGWIGAWVGIAVAIGIAELAAFQRQGDPRLLIHEDPIVHLRTIFAIAARYLWMSVSAANVAALAEPPAAESWLDPWWLAGLFGLLAIGVRMVQTSLRGDEEACMWLFAAAAFGPVSQVFPFVFPMADHYLYPILPGLIGAVILALLPAWRWLAERHGAAVSRATWAGALVFVAVFAVQSHARAPVYVDNVSLMRDAALAYPNGMSAQLLRAHRAADEGNAAASAAAFRKAVDLGFSDLRMILQHPQLKPLLPHPDFQSMLRYLAQTDIDRLSQHEDPEQSELLTLSLAHEVQGDLRKAIEITERAVAAGGPHDEEARKRLDLLRRAQARRSGERPKP